MFDSDQPVDRSPKWMGWAHGLTLLFALVLPTLVLADDVPNGTAKQTIESEEQAVLTWAPDLGIWTLVTFLLLLVLLYQTAWRPILQGLDKREQTLLQIRADAEKARDKAQALRAEFDRKLQEAHEQAAAILAEARRDAEVFKSSERERVKGEIQNERDRLHREIETARDQALQDIYSQAVQLATLMSAKAIHREISTEDHRRLLDEALVELNQTMQPATV